MKKNIILFSFLISACDIFSSPQSKVVIDMDRAMCARESVSEYFSADSLQRSIADSMLNTFEDAVAEGCATGSLKIVKEIEVTPERYIIKASKGDRPVMNYTVVKVDGSWKILSILRARN